MYQISSNDVENENRLLALIVNKPSRYFLMCDRIREDMILNPHNRMIYSLIESLIKKDNSLAEQPNLFVPLSIKLMEIGEVGEITKRLNKLKDNYIYQLTDSSVDMVVEGVLINAVKYKLSNLAYGLSEALQKSKSISEIQDIITEMQKASMFNDNSSNPTTMEDAERELNEMHNSNFTYIPTGMSNLDDFLGGGWSPLHFIYLAARPGMGKTACICLHSLTSALHGFPVAIFSLEETAKSLYARIAAYFCNSTYSEILNNKFHTEAHKKSYEKAKEVVKKLPIYIYDTDKRSSDVNDILNVATVWIRTKGVKLMFADHIGLIKDRTVRGGETRAVINSVSFKFREWQKTHQIPFLPASQLNREVEKRDDKRPRLSDLKDSGNLEQDGVGVLFLYREDYYEKKRHKESGEPGEYIYKNEIEYIWAKYRLGDPDDFLFDCEIGHSHIYRKGFPTRKVEPIYNLHNPRPQPVPQQIPISTSFGIETSFKSHNNDDFPPF